MARALQDSFHPLTTMVLAMFENVLAAATASAVVFCTSSPIAAPFMDIRANVSAMAIPELLPEGVSISCRGDSIGIGDGCASELALTQAVTQPGTYELTSTGSLVVTNTSDEAIDGFIGLDIMHSAFNPGGPATGISIDNYLTQAASFRSSVTGPGVGGTQSCSVGFQGYSGYITSPTSCGVSAPDWSFTNAGADLVNFLPGAELVFTWVIELAATFEFEDEAQSEVPSPGSLALVLVGLGGLALRKRRRS
jgi:hypothetical protein